MLVTENPADLMIKSFDVKSMDKMLGKMSTTMPEGRAVSAPQAANLGKNPNFLEDNHFGCNGADESENEPGWRNERRECERAATAATVSELHNHCA